MIFNGDPEFLNALKNTLLITLVQMVFVFPAPIVLALLLNSLLSERIKRIVQSVLYLPHFLSWVIVIAIFQQMLGGSRHDQQLPAVRTASQPDRHHRQPRHLHTR